MDPARAVARQSWSRPAVRYGKPFTAELSGPAGGTYASDPANPAAEHISLDAVEFCRTLAGRAHPTGLLTTIVPFLPRAGTAQAQPAAGKALRAGPD